MVGIQGLGGVPDPKPEGPAKVNRDRDAELREKAAAAAGSAQDDVSISNAARAAADLARLVQLATRAADIRTDKVEEARARIDRGDYKNPEIVSKVAERLLKYLD